MNLIKKMICSILFLGLALNSFGQKLMEDIIYLKNGSILRGQIMEYKPDGNIKIEIAGGSVLVYPASDVVEIKKEEAKNQPQYRLNKADRPLLIPENKKIYNIFMGKLMMGINAFSEPAAGIGLYWATGYRFNRFANVGLGIGIERNDAFNFMPIFVDFRGYLMKTSTSMYYSLGVGYSVALHTASWRFDGDVESQTGGLYLHPAIGVRFKSRKRTHLMMDFGYTIQSNNLTFINSWSGNSTTQKTTLFRPSFRIGLMF
ncbi:MAG: hypothetical protein MK212_19550 [Saprospiraceae bacterium]|nr:hypothetical protein [Saprospiraceae bacterium]